MIIIMLFTSREIRIGENCRKSGTVHQKDALDFTGQFRISCTCDLLKSILAFYQYFSFYCYLVYFSIALFFSFLELA